MPASRPQAFSNPVYPFFTPQQQRPPTINGPMINKSDDDVELLRQYGLDKFNLNDNYAKQNGMPSTSSSQFKLTNANTSRPIEPLDQNNLRSEDLWTKFD